MSKLVKIRTKRVLKSFKEFYRGRKCYVRNRRLDCPDAILDAIAMVNGETASYNNRQCTLVKSYRLVEAAFFLPRD